MFIKKLLFILLTLSALFLTGCASNANFQAMTYQTKITEKPVNTALLHNVTVLSVAGGSETNPLWTSQVNNENFKKALSNSLDYANLLNHKNTAMYGLSAKLLKLQQPFMGLNLTVKSDVEYELKELKTNKIVLKDTISNAYTAKFGESLYAVERLRKANEGAIRENIKQLIDKLYLDRLLALKK